MLSETVKNVYNFDSLTTKTKKQIEQNTKKMSLARGKVLDTQKSAEHFFVIETGTALALDPATETISKLLRKGETIGAENIFTEPAASQNIKAATACELNVISLTDLKKITEKDAQLCSMLANYISTLYIEERNRLQAHKLLNVSKRTAMTLENLSQGKYEFSLAITQDQLAELVGASRERVNKTIRNFIKFGWIVKKEKVYKITNRPELKKHYK